VAGADDTGGFVASWKVLVVLAVALAACAGESSAPAPRVLIEGTNRTVDVSIKEFEFHLATTEFVRGETVGFHIVNEGLVSHEFRLTTDAALSEFMALLPTAVDVALAQQAFDETTTVYKLKPGETLDVAVPIDQTDPYTVLVCLIPGHFEAGMKEELFPLP
jgi:uncharacterized cupredoxin-like copper-binding protein